MYKWKCSEVSNKGFIYKILWKYMKLEVIKVDLGRRRREIVLVRKVFGGGGIRYFRVKG